jgi:hypothetical protein
MESRPAALGSRPEACGRSIVPGTGSSHPTTGIAACCARAASGHAATAPATPAMNSRRRIRHPSCRIVGNPIAVGLAAKGPLPLPCEGGRMPGPASGQPPWRVFDVGVP